MGMDFTKTVIKPIRQVIRMSDARGWVQDYKASTQEMVWLQGEVHLGRKSGLMRFTTAESRDTFSRIVLHDIRPPKRVLDLAAAVDKRINDINKGRAWMAAHMRRGDCESSCLRCVMVTKRGCSRYRWLDDGINH